MTILLGILRSIIDFVLSYWRQIAIAILIGIAIYNVYNYGYRKATQEVTTHYEEIIKKQHDDVVTKIDNIEKLSVEQSAATRKNHDELVNDMTKLSSDFKKKKFVITKDGECTLTPEFLQNFNSIISRGNRK